MSKRNTKSVIQTDIQTDEVLDLVEIPIDEITVEPTVESSVEWEPGESTPRYVVIRDGLRVSDKDYSKPDDPKAISERDFWKKVITRWPDGTRVEIVKYDKKKHRVW